MKQRFTTYIKSGKIEELIARAIGGYLKGRKDGACVFEIYTGADVERRLRSSAQNRYYHGVVVTTYLQAMIDAGDNTAEEVRKQLRLGTLNDALHELLKFEFAGCEVIDENTGEVRRLPMSTASMTTVEIGVYWDKIRASCLDRYGADIPPHLMMFLWINPMENQIFKELNEWAAYAIAVDTGIRSSYTYERLTKGKSDEDRRTINATLRRLIEEGRIVAYKMGAVTFIELPQQEMDRIKSDTKSWRKTKKQ